MRRRAAGFTLIEMLVSVALILFIMVILTEAFGKGLESFRTLKAIGDMEARLRAAAAIIRRDLAADHFEGKRRLSDPVTPINRWNAMGVVREGFFRIEEVPSTSTGEGSDTTGIVSRRGISRLYCTVKLRGNNRSEFFNAFLDPSLAGASPLVDPNVRSTFFDQPSDARFQDTPHTYSTQWAEVLYHPVRTGQLPGTNIGLYTIYRAQLAIVADNSRLNWDTIPPSPGCPMPPSRADQHKEMSCYVGQVGTPPNVRPGLYFNNPSDLVKAANRTLAPGRRALDTWPLTPILTDVVSFNIADLRDNFNDFREELPGVGVDTQTWGEGNWTVNNVQRPIRALRVTIRVWDLKTKQTRQITIVQEM